MKVILIFVIALAIFGIYINRSYAQFYSYIGTVNLKPNVLQGSYYASSVTGSSQTIKYVALGDSLSAGVGADEYKSSFPELYADNLSHQGPSVYLKVLAQPAATTESLIKYQLEEAVKERPDHITILIGINDVHNGVRSDQFKQNYQKIIKTLKQKTQAHIVLLTIPVLGSGKILYPPWDLALFLRTSDFNNIIKGLALEENVQVIDLSLKVRSEFGRNNQLYSADQFHPSSLGYKYWIEVINEN